MVIKFCCWCLPRNGFERKFRKFFNAAHLPRSCWRKLEMDLKKKKNRTFFHAAHLPRSCWRILEMDLKENFVLFFNAAQLPRSCCWRNSTLAYLKAFYSSQLPWVPSSRTLKEFLKEVPTRETRSLSHETTKYSSYIWSPQLFYFIFHF